MIDATSFDDCELSDGWVLVLSSEIYYDKDAGRYANDFNTNCLSFGLNAFEPELIKSVFFENCVRISFNPPINPLHDSFYLDRIFYGVDRQVQFDFKKAGDRGKKISILAHKSRCMGYVDNVLEHPDFLLNGGDWRRIQLVLSDYNKKLRAKMNEKYNV